jgi:Predicted Zn-dependent peptidases
MIARIRSYNSIISAIPAILLAFALAANTLARAPQSAPEPRREELLNGLRVLVLTQPASPNVTVKLRIHSGSAFDLQGRAGTMALLADMLFPDPETRDFFTEELGGSLEVTTDYDAINIRMTGRANEFERMLELLRTALVSTPITNENVIRLRDARIKMVREMSVSPSFVADQAIARRLFGDYPYGRPSAGATETLARVERADILLARDRFLTPDNATLVVTGGVEHRRAVRALRQLLGTWRKSDKLVPSTFRQPEPTDSKALIIDMPGAENVEVRLAARTLPRADKDYAAMMLLTLLARDKWQSALPELNKSAFFVRHKSNLLSGMFVMGASVRTSETAQSLEAARNVLRALAQTPVTAAELDRARSEATAILNKEASDANAVAEMLLDVETYKLDASADYVRALSKLTPADLQKVAARVFREAEFASIAVGSSSQFKSDLERAFKVEVLGEVASPKPSGPASSTKTP